jgi:hypothetical protein
MLKGVSFIQKGRSYDMPNLEGEGHALRNDEEGKEQEAQ